MITNIINPLLQAVSFISIWYLYQTMSKIKPLRGHLLLLFLSYVAAASYFSLVKIVVDFQLSLSLTSYISKVILPSTLTYIS